MNSFLLFPILHSTCTSHTDSHIVLYFAIFQYEEIAETERELVETTFSLEHNSCDYLVNHKSESGSRNSVSRRRNCAYQWTPSTSAAVFC